MLDIIKSYVKDNEYYLIITDDYLFIKNYQKIIELENNSIIILIKNKTYHIKGNNFKLIESDSNDLKISGTIERIDII